MKAPLISVILCTHNPTEAYLRETLAALETQTLPLGDWELLIIDNASTPSVASRFDVAFHPAGRIIHEETLGLTQARLRGIAESRAGILVFVDDDNILASDFLEQADAIGKNWPKIGAWGGQILPRFEVTPAPWTKPYINALAMRECDQDFWSNVPDDKYSLPCGAGMCVRRSVADAYIKALRADPRRGALDRRGASLVNGGDTDMAMTSYDLELGTGVFAALKLTHLIPSRRVEKDYLLRLIESGTYSQVMLAYYRGVRPVRRSRSERLFDWYRHLHLESRIREFEQAKLRARETALRDIEKAERELAQQPQT
ncbi:MAG TPA: glycosyltransferase [Chthoniobacteraceae bacterium]|jgi:glycosyltransferase involved in cell wall biosynthesis|nr:glycosyltransferase [Chthoniobacteraceae bacterium]